jgi:LacI family transcriptional regulator
VPRDVALLGVGNEPTYVELIAPQLSSVDPGYEERGAFAARLLLRVLDGDEPSQTTWLLPPKGVVTRGSTSVFAVDDKAVRPALQLMHDTFDTPNCMAEVVASAGVSRRTLDDRFKRIVGRSVSAELWRIRFAHARRLLREGNLSILNVALSSGFLSAQAFATMFRNRYGISPTQFRGAPDETR